jgi:hypothetical protein
MVLWLKVFGAKAMVAKYAFSIYTNSCLVAILAITPHAHSDLSCSAALKNNY